MPPPRIPKQASGRGMLGLSGTQLDELLRQGTIGAGILSTGLSLSAGITGFLAGQDVSKTLKRAGAEEARRVRLEGMRLIGAQRASYGASGVDVNRGTPVDVMSESALFLGLEALQREYHFLLEAAEARSTAAGQLVSGIAGGLSSAVNTMTLLR